MKHVPNWIFNPMQSRATAISVYLILAVLMIATRPYHFSAVINLPSASTAIFFICGMLGAKYRIFVSFLVLSVLIDLASSYHRGAFGDCITPSYPFLFIGYYVLWWAGQKSMQLSQNDARVSAFIKSLVALFNLWLATSVAFLTSNASYYWFSGKFTELSLSEYAGRVSQYYLPYVQNPVFYVVLTLAIYMLCVFLITQQNRSSSIER